MALRLEAITMKFSLFGDLSVLASSPGVGSGGAKRKGTQMAKPSKSRPGVETEDAHGCFYAMSGLQNKGEQERQKKITHAIT